MINIFKMNDYRACLRQTIADRRKREKTLTITKLSGDIRMTRTNLSQAINGKKHLSSDQLYGICQSIGFSEIEKSYLLLLRELTLSRVKARKIILQAKLEALRMKAIPYEESEIHILDDYFSHPLVPIIHGFLMCEQYRKSPVDLKRKLNLSDNSWNYVLEVLVKAKGIALNQSKIQVLHSPYIPSPRSSRDMCYQIGARLRVAEQKLAQTKIDDFMYNWWFSCDEKSIRYLKIGFLQLVQKIYEDAKNVSHDSLYQLNLDILGV